jgi:A/G-specific adenine glycosylase
MTGANFAKRLLGWWDVHGRRDFPWQVERTPYRVWLAEIMLQQTQAATVIDYFQRFTARFPDLDSLARAELDEIMALWSGLGYYARARNLHKTARICMEQFDGCLPEEPEQLLALPGIGRSTAHAIIAQAHDRRAAILDGNVKRVLARHGAIPGWPGKSAVIKTLWEEAERRTPPDRARDYTQAIMDLGATVCSARQPTCSACPVSPDCHALAQGRVSEFPARKPVRPRPERRQEFLLLENRIDEILLLRRPPSGIWGGLWCLPAADEAPGQPAATNLVGELVHDFSHFRLHMKIRHGRIDTDIVHDRDDLVWMSIEKALAAGLPRPVRQVLEDFVESGKSK